MNSAPSRSTADRGCSFKNPKTGRDIIVKDVIADAFLQQILLRPAEYDVIATLNLNGDYVSDALAAQVGGIGIAPGANLSDTIAMFEATHGTAPKYAGKDYVNPGSEILSAADDAECTWAGRKPLKLIDRESREVHSATRL